MKKVFVLVIMVIALINCGCSDKKVCINGICLGDSAECVSNKLGEMGLEVHQQGNVIVGGGSSFEAFGIMWKYVGCQIKNGEIDRISMHQYALDISDNDMKRIKSELERMCGKQSATVRENGVVIYIFGEPQKNNGAIGSVSFDENEMEFYVDIVSPDDYM